MPMNLDSVGSVSSPGERSWDHKDCLLYALDRESFLSAVSSHASAASAARRVVSERLARVPVA